MAVEEIKSWIADSRNIVFFGGAGTSTESQIPDFRSATGLYQTASKHAFPPEVMLSRSFFMERTAEFFDFYRACMVHREAKPNAAHEVLAQLEQTGKLRAVVTQNIDGLHQMAGSQHVLELHGSVHRNYCMGCGKFFDLDHVTSDETMVPRCDACGGIVKPDVVLYEESLDWDILSKARKHIAEADVLIVGGTSLTVNPAAALVGEYGGDKLVLINQSSTPYDSRATHVIRDSIGKVLKALVS
ncbi:NAD-dependent protein deacylase [Paenibacillus elgii]